MVSNTKKDFSRDACPLGAVRIRWKGKSRVRWIKVTHHGPPRQRWLTLARHWWLKNKGPVPAGLRVVHADGNTLNDDPSNYTLMSGGEVALLYVRTRPGVWERMVERRARATAAANVDRSRLARATRFLPGYWYPVDIEKRIIWNQPHKKRWQAFADFGMNYKTRNGRGVLACVLGWPSLTDGAALALQAMVDGARTSSAIAQKCRQLLERYGKRPRYKYQYFLSCAVELRAAGMIQTNRAAAGRRSLFSPLPHAFNSREIVCPVVPIRGWRLSAPEFQDFTRKERETDGQ